MPNIHLKLKKSHFNDVYYPLLHDYSRRYEVYYGGAGSGKSVFIAQKLIVKACKSKRRILVIRKVKDKVKESVFEQLISVLKRWNLYNYCKINLSTHTITLPNESIFLCKGIDDPEKVKSITDITDIWVEEATELDFEDFEQLDLRLRSLVGNLQIFCSFNPIGKGNWVYKKWFAEDAKYDASETHILKTTYKDNRFTTEAYIRMLENKIHTNPHYYKVYVLGEFATLEGLVFSNWREEKFDYMELAKTLEHRTGMDLGWVDPSAIIDTLYDRQNRTIYVFNEFYKKGCQLSDLASAISGMGLKKSKIYVDSAEPRSIQYFKNNGINAVGSIKGADSVKAGIMFLQDHTIIVHPKCENFKTDLENFSYKKNKQGEWTEDTTHEWSHAIDACRYAYSDIYTNKSIKTLSKSVLGL